MERLANLQRGAESDARLHAERLTVGINRPIDLGLHPQKKNTPSLLAADETNTNGKSLPNVRSRRIDVSWWRCATASIAGGRSRSTR